jgi:hypothetical protein
MSMGRLRERGQEKSDHLGYVGIRHNPLHNKNRFFAKFIGDSRGVEPVEHQYGVGASGDGAY